VLAGSGEEGLRLARQRRPDVITLDAMMPGMDGWAVLATLKADPDLCDVPVVMATMIDNKGMGFALGAADYLTKPIDRQQLSRVLAKYRCTAPVCTVLLVEDDVVTRQMMCNLLEREGWDVVQAANGRQALDVMSHLCPALVLLDLMMPEMDGFEFVVEMHRHPEWCKVPIVVLTAKDITPEDRRRLNGSVERIVQKGAFQHNELLGLVRQVVARNAPRPAPAR
jgi:CheY-like chemotaxis protein